ncbi:hypothetical protein BKA56DRAFT_599163 [Ilyonectria sp. MPI-CAGE-AT-0026]|nr:hypothetical protein BKA56DRAFT_599163 [Ilyonectria sp. MPI-CAGE-AT-0026]
MSSASNVYRTVSAAWTEGRLENVLQRQKELAALHGSVKKSSSNLIRALNQDLQTTDESAAEELQLTLDTIKHLYDGLNFPASLANERSIKQGASSVDNLVPLGPTLIDPAPHAPVASTLIPLAAAVAAGSAVVALVHSSVPAVNDLLRKILRESVDVEAVDLTDNDSADTRQQLGLKLFGVAVLQNLHERASTTKLLSQTNPLVRILSPPSGVCAVFVDRSVRDLETAASHLHNSILASPRHHPLRLPRLCFVDETIINDLEGLLLSAGSSSIEPLQYDDDNKKTQALYKQLKSTFPSLSKKTANGTSNYHSSVVGLKSSDPITAESIRAVARSIADCHSGILLIPTRSLDHGIDILSKVNDNMPSQATYVFGESKPSFYVAAFSKTVQVFINAIPPWSLVAVAPNSVSVSNRILYSREDFSVNKPVIQDSLKPARAVKIDPKSFWPLMSHTLRLGKIKQPKGGSLSYFERGLILGLALSLVAISGVSVGVYRASHVFFKRT